MYLHVVFPIRPLHAKCYFSSELTSFVSSNEICENFRFLAMTVFRFPVFFSCVSKIRHCWDFLQVWLNWPLKDRLCTLHAPRGLQWNPIYNRTQLSVSNRSYRCFLSYLCLSCQHPTCWMQDYLPSVGNASLGCTCCCVWPLVTNKAARYRRQF